MTSDVVRRFFGFFCLILGAAAAFLDYAATEGPPTVVDMRPVGYYWGRTSPASLEGFAQFAEREFSRGFWETVVRPILEAPAAPVALGLGSLLLLWSWVATRRKRRNFWEDRSRA